MSLTPGKAKHMQALSNKDGVIAAAAMDQRGSLQKSLATAKGVPQKEIPDSMMEEFKVAVSKILTPHASAILLDPQWGLPAAKARASNAGLLLAYEESGYDNTQPGRLPDLLPNCFGEAPQGLGCRRSEDPDLLLAFRRFQRQRHQARVHRTHWLRMRGHTIFLSSWNSWVTIPLVGDEKGLEFAKKKPDVVIGAMTEFSKPQYQVDVLKVEVPINAEFVEGSSVFKGQKAYSREEALHLFRKAAAVASKPFIYLSAGVSNAQFIESLNMASESGTDYSGVLCGRATWKEGIPVYAKKGVHALEDWLATEGVKNINAVNNAIKSAKPWSKKLSASA